jgi:hypothetical protein
MPEWRRMETEAFGLTECEKRAGKLSERGARPVHISNQKDVWDPSPMVTCEMERKGLRTATKSFQMGVSR